MINIDFPFDNFQFNSNSIFDALPDDVRALLHRNVVAHQYKKGEILFREGSYPTGIYCIKKGKIKKYKTDKDGREHIFYVCGNGDLLGYHAVIAEEKYTDTAVTLEESTISFIPKDDFLGAVKSSPALSQRLLKVMSHEFGVLTNGLVIFSQKSVRERLALCLLVLRNKYKKDAYENRPVELNLSRNDLAKYVGTTRETVTRLLQIFNEEGLIEMNGKRILLKDPLEISRIANLY